jgi:multidrug efflux pump subunit AcrB
MKKQLITLGIALAIFFTVFMAFAAIPAKTTPKTDTKVFISAYPVHIQQYINGWSKYGYKVDKLECQSVSVGNGYTVRKGEFILVMVKN